MLMILVKSVILSYPSTYDIYLLVTVSYCQYKNTGKHPPQVNRNKMWFVTAFRSQDLIILSDVGPDWCDAHAGALTHIRTRSTAYVRNEHRSRGA